MKRRYNEIMEHIEVTPEMHRRILERIQEKSIASSRKVLHLPAWKKMLSVAACFVLLLMGTALLPRLLQGEVADPPELAGGWGIEEASSLQELADWVGFEVSEASNLPFEPSEISYTSYWRELAQIEYRRGEECAVFRKSAGGEDNSGDYSEYTDIRVIQAGSRAVTLKGNDGSYSLAVWTEGGFAYSLHLSPALGEAEWEAVLLP